MPRLSFFNLSALLLIQLRTCACIQTHTRTHAHTYTIQPIHFTECKLLPGHEAQYFLSLVVFTHVLWK